MPHRQRRGELGEGVVLGAGGRGSPRWPAIATKTHKGHRTCRNRTLLASHYCCVQLLGDLLLWQPRAQACGRQSRRFRERTCSSKHENPGAWGTRTRSHSNVAKWELILIANNHWHRATTVFCLSSCLFDRAIRTSRTSLYA